jgi:hypothetical protein
LEAATVSTAAGSRRYLKLELIVECLLNLWSLANRLAVRTWALKRPGARRVEPPGCE